MTRMDGATMEVSDVIRWSLMQVKNFDGARTRHLVGRLGGHGRMTAPVVSLDLRSLCATTQSGRSYRLSGPPLPDPDARYVFTSWARVSGGTNTKDMTRALMWLRKRRGLNHLNPW